MSVLLFVLDYVFFALVAAALVRAWMNTCRLRMTEQPGRFVMAITDWLVMPLRKSLPRGLAQANFDWASVMAALMLALTFSVLMHGLSPVVSGLQALGWMITIPFLALQFVAVTLLQVTMGLTLVYAVLSWVQPHAPVGQTLGRMVEPVLAPIRRAVPPIGGVDLSVLILVLIIQVILMLIR